MAVSFCPHSGVIGRLILVLLLSLFTAKGQETPSFFVPNWSTGISHQTNFCRLHEAVENGQIERRNALRGLEISVGFMKYQLTSTTNDDNNGKAVMIDPGNPNIAMEILDELAIMGGFTYRNSYSVIDPPVVGNETWTELLFWGVGASR